MWCCITPERIEKTQMIMEALADGWPGARVICGEPPIDDEPLAVWGQQWLTERVLPDAVKRGRPYWHIDNGFRFPANGRPTGYHRLTYCGMSPAFLEDAPERRELLSRVRLKPWRKDGDHILLALPGMSFGKSIGMNVRDWCTSAPLKVRKRTKRPVLIREKGCDRSLADDLRGAWAVVTHSSNVAVDAVIAGYPVFVAPTSPAAPVGRIGFDELEDPIFPDREKWLRSLMAQQFTLEEMRTGEAYRCLRLVMERSPCRQATTPI